MNKNIFIWTEIINVGKIGKIALESFRKYHPNLHVFIYGKWDDFEWIDPLELDNATYVALGSDNDIVQSFNKGHEGTAKLWAKLIQERPEKYMIHFDSDIIFRGDVVQDIITRIEEGYDLIGAVRNYKNNLCHNDDVRHLQDVCATGCFAFNRELISNFDYNTLTSMCQGIHNPLGHPVMDFFDPVMFDILKNGGKISFLDFDDVGGCNNQGSRNNKYSELNNMNAAFKIEFGEKMSHFSAVGSGMNFFHNSEKIRNVPSSYRDYAIDRYALFCKIFYNEDIGIDVSQYNSLFNGIEWY